jgi:hypothetical protein
VRTTGVRLIADIDQFKRAFRSGADAVRHLKDTAEKATGTFRNMGANARKTSADIARNSAMMRANIAEMDRQISVVRRNLQGLSTAYAEGNTTVVEQIKEQQKRLKELTTVRKLLPPGEAEKAGLEAGRRFHIGFMSIARNVAIPLGSTILGGVAYMLPLLGAMVSGAIIGGAGIGGVAGGLALAARDDRVKGAVNALGMRIETRLSGVTEKFVGQAIVALGVFEQAINRMDLEGLLGDSTKFVQPLAKGLAEMVRQIVEGLRIGIAAAGPAVEAIAQGLAGIGRTIKDIFSRLSDNGIEAAVALRQAFSLLEATLASIGIIINGLTEAYGFLVKFGAFGRDAQLEYIRLELNAKLAKNAADDFNTSIQKTTQVIDPATGAVRRYALGTFTAADGMTKMAISAKLLEQNEASLKAAQDALKASQDDYKASIENINPALARTTQLSAGLKQVWQNTIGVAVSASEANEAYAKSWDALSKSVKDNGTSLDINTTKGRANRDALEELLLANNESYFANVANGMSIDEARKQHEKRTKAIEKETTRTFGNNKTTQDLIKTYGKIPPDKHTKVLLDGLATIADKLQALYVSQRALAEGKTIAAVRNEGKAAMRSLTWHAGGWTGPGPKMQPAGVVHADEYVIRKQSRQQIEKQHPGLLEEMNATGQVPAGYAVGGHVMPVETRRGIPMHTNLRKSWVPSKEWALSRVIPKFGDWPSSPSAQRGDSGVWRKIVALIQSTGPMSGSFGNAYRPGDPKWHGSGRAVDWMGYGQDRLASFLANKRPLELIHRTNSRDYAYTRGQNKGSFNNALMEAHRNHIHIAMQNGGIIREPVLGVGASGATYSFAERGPERVLSAAQTAAGGGAGSVTINMPITVAAGAHPAEVGRQVVAHLSAYFERGGRMVVHGKPVLP